VIRLFFSSAAAFFTILAGTASSQTLTAPNSRLTFTKDVAPIVFARCSSCHRPGGPAPFNLLSYGDVSAHAAQIASAVKNRVMPPWKPEPGFGEFVGERRLSDRELTTILQWIDSGLAEGTRADLPPRPATADGWQLGKPDLILSMSQAYTVQAGAHDVFRNFIIPVEIPGKRYVRAWEFKPGNNGAIHHVTMGFDRTPHSRELDEQDPAPGYEGLVPFSVSAPDGYFLGWAPGTDQVQRALPGMPWTLERGDFVLSTHLRAHANDKTVQVSLGLYFTDSPPSRAPALVKLGRQDIDIPAGESRYTIRDTYTMPVDGDVYSVFPHAHFLAQETKAFATLPDGTTRWLLDIKHWDFNWQDVYKYVTPVFLPAGSVVTMEYTYDNSAANPHNPHSPPQRVTFGPNSSDEMGDFVMQVLPRDPAQLARLVRDAEAKFRLASIAGVEAMLRRNADDAGLHDEAALLYQDAGDIGQAAVQFAESLRIRPDSPAAHNNLGSALINLGRNDEARVHFLRALQLKPDYAQPHFNLGMLLKSEGRLQEAAAEFREAVRIAPYYTGAYANLGIVLQLAGKIDEAMAQYRKAIQIRPTDPEPHTLLAYALSSAGKFADAAAEYRRAIDIRPDVPVLVELAWLLATSADASVRRPSEAVSVAERAVASTEPPSAVALDVLSAALAATGDFSRAIDVGEKALRQAVTEGSDAVSHIRERLAFYKERQRLAVGR
jgi:Flp pilus assembly protein TadD